MPQANNIVLHIMSYIKIVTVSLGIICYFKPDKSTFVHLMVLSICFIIFRENRR